MSSDEKINTDNQNIAVEKFRQTTGLCGPAALKILLSHFGKTFTEDQLAALAGVTKAEGQDVVGVGTEHENMIEAIKEIGGYVFAKEEGTIAELEYFIKEERLPVIIGWFDASDPPEDHYSVAVNITDKNIIIVDPVEDKVERWLDRQTFPKIWFDFVGKENKIVSWGWYMVVSFEKLSADRFKVPDGNYH